jgi:hypothetical protein
MSRSREDPDCGSGRPDRQEPERSSTSPAERLLARGMIDEAGVGKPLSERTLQRQRSLESYLRGEMLPRFIERAKEIEQSRRRHQRELADVHRALSEECGEDRELFAGLWTERAHTWDFSEINQLIGEHNEWYPVERNLPMDPRTRDYVLIRGRSYRQAPLDPDWVLERFPPWP